MKHISQQPGRLLALIILTVASCMTASAQKNAVKVQSFTLTADHIASADRRNDFNNVPCALLKIQVLDDIERVEGNIIGDVVNNGVEKWLYMCKGSRNVKLHFKNNLPLSIIFRNYKINGLESNRVYELVLDAPNKAAKDSTDIPSSTLRLRTTPTNAEVTLWGDNLQRQTYRTKEDGTLELQLPYGRYHYIARAAEHEDKEGSVFVNDENKWEPITLQPFEGTLVVTCQTKGGQLYVDEQKIPGEKNVTQWTLQQLPIGQHIVAIKKNKYVTETDTVTIKSGQTSIVSFGKLKSKSDVLKAEIRRVKQEHKDTYEADEEETDKSGNALLKLWHKVKK